jgi:glycosyltransferase involved in cell wall biosynthesis
VVVTSHWSAADLRRRYAVPRLSVAVPGAAPAPPARGSEPPHLLVLGTLTPVKNHLTAVAALEQVADLDWTAAFVGPPSPDAGYAGRLAQRVAGSPVADRVELPGVLTGEDLERQWQRTDLLLVPSLVETYGLVVTEALAHGIPCLVAAGTGAVEALAGSGPGPDVDQDELAGAAVDPGDPAAWAAALRAWATDPGLRDRWRHAAADRRDHLRPWRDTAEDLWAAVSGDQ